MSDWASYFQKKPDDTILVGAVGMTSAAPSGRHSSEIFYYVGLGVLILSFVLTFLSTGDLIQERQQLKTQYLQSVEEKKTEEKNLEALKVLSTQVDTLKEDQALVAKAIPFDPRPDQVIAYLEYLTDQIKKKELVITPESISWAPVSPQDVTNEDFQAVDIMEYRFDVKGSYKALLEYLRALRNHERLFDVRSLSGIRLMEDGSVTAQVSFWAYSLPL
jgi:hypothetical protein